MGMFIALTKRDVAHHTYSTLVVPVVFVVASLCLMCVVCEDFSCLATNGA